MLPLILCSLAIAWRLARRPRRRLESLRNLPRSNDDMVFYLKGTAA